MGWLTGYAYRKSHVINAASGAGTLYQIPIIIHSGSGTDSGNDVYLNGHALNFPNDIRITKDDGTTLLDHFCEDLTADPAKFWLEESDDLSSVNRTIYVYYGKSGDATASNGANTFLFFDHFTSFDTTTIWSAVHQEGSQTITDGTILDFQTDNYPNALTDYWRVVSQASHSPPFALMTRMKQKFDYARETMAGLVQTATSSYSPTCECLHFRNVRYENWKSRSYVSAEVVTDLGVTAIDYHVLTVGYISGSHALFYIDGVQKADHTTQVPTSNQIIQYYFKATSTSQAGFLIDWVAKRKFVYPEPTHGSWGSEETSGWTGKISGVTNPAKVMGVPVANIAKVKGV